jgi:hypothetical protein
MYARQVSGNNVIAGFSDWLPDRDLRPYNYEFFENGSDIITFL